MTNIEWLCVLMIALGTFFFLAGTVGLWRFPDVLSRLHALTKADNLGLGFIIVGVIPLVTDAVDAVQLLVIWFAVMLSGAISCYLLASSSEEVQGQEKLKNSREIEPRSKSDD
ncbi:MULTISPECIES: cation:proton antiporter [Pseudoalteromonas]|uniref:cation:proton antiporter n=1 Tax=Pseudoalteromonas TaxID=53246 RepID=UPI001109889B|nr:MULTISPECIES: monovalent cation/H(+) antiporter subunit G [Pseudoalteromonas]MCG9760014.1 monovalent cation/H(+) antiporter subunit G [Pseudoalteromonas sp. Isolate6]NKC19040.1 Na+/H+ antiporter subunit G [Pseudoalteromonas galatheae]